MLGYVNVSKSALSESEYNVYRGYYCGVCKSIGERYGQVPRLILSYDSVFLAMVLASLGDFPDAIVREHCVIHPIASNPVAKGDPAIDYAADMLLILAYYNFLDDISDGQNIKGFSGKTILEKSHGAIQKKYPEICDSIRLEIAELSDLEKDCSGDLDLTAGTFGKILAETFSGYAHDEKTNRILAHLGSNLGKWIYIMDALDDLDEDKKTGRYNPLIYRDRGIDGLEELLFWYLGEVAGAVNLLDIRKNKGIIDNIIWFGLRARTEVLLKKGMIDGSI